MKNKTLILAFAVILMACKKPNSDTAPAPSEPQPIKGSISGKIKQYNANGSLVTGSLADVTVSIDGRSNSAVTDASGAYTLNEVEAGILDLSINANDGSGTKVQQLSFVGNGNLLLNEDFSRKSKDTITGRINDTIFNGTKGVYIRCKLKGVANAGSLAVVILFGKTANLQPSNPSSFDYALQGYMQIQGNPSVPTFANFLPYETITEKTGITAGSLCFANAFPTAMNGAYYDVYIQKNIYMSAGNASGPSTSFTVKQ